MRMRESTSVEKVASGFVIEVAAAIFPTGVGAGVCMTGLGRETGSSCIGLAFEAFSGAACRGLSVFCRGAAMAFNVGIGRFRGKGIDC